MHFDLFLNLWLEIQIVLFKYGMYKMTLLELIIWVMSGRTLSSFWRFVSTVLNMFNTPQFLTETNGQNLSLTKHSGKILFLRFSWDNH